MYRTIRTARALIVPLLACLQFGCATIDPDAHADALARPAHLTREYVRGGAFTLTAYARITQPGRALRVYIEGDGLAWISRTQPSMNPTPRVAMGLALAAQDDAPNVVYLARPCQFTPMSMNPRCGIPMWTSKRFAPEIIDAMNEAVSHFAAMTPEQPVEIVGYSGGGALAVLIAARRADVASLRTVAGNLDDEWINRLHHVSAMPESSNPIDVAGRVASIPQIHFSGGDDAIVPPAAAQRFVDATGTRCARAITIDGLSHSGDWSRPWRSLLAIEPLCQAK
jgi:hypothetical protein